MPADPPAADEPDHFFLGRAGDRLADGGPRYKESPADPPDAARPTLAEPYNAVTAAVFVLLVAYWAGRLHGRWRTRPFVACCLPILLAGGVGGTLYHATRADRLYFLLDVIPISLLGAAGSVYLTLRLGRSVGLLKVLAIAVGVLAVYLFVNGVLFRVVPTTNRNLTVNLSYASLAVILLVPLGAVLLRTRGRHGGWVAGGLTCFAVAWVFRLIDGTPFDTLPMGTHWLWHLFGAATTFAVVAYFDQLEGEPPEGAGRPPA